MVSSSVWVIPDAIQPAFGNKCASTGCPFRGGRRLRVDGAKVAEANEMAGATQAPSAYQALIPARRRVKPHNHMADQGLTLGATLLLGVLPLVLLIGAIVAFVRGGGPSDGGA